MKHKSLCIQSRVPIKCFSLFLKVWGFRFVVGVGYMCGSFVFCPWIDGENGIGPGSAAHHEFVFTRARDFPCRC